MEKNNNIDYNLYTIQEDFEYSNPSNNLINNNVFNQYSIHGTYSHSHTNMYQPIKNNYSRIYTL